MNEEPTNTPTGMPYPPESDIVKTIVDLYPAMVLKEITKKMDKIGLFPKIKCKNHPSCGQLVAHVFAGKELFTPNVDMRNKAGDYFRLKYACIKCGTIRTWGNVEATVKTTTTTLEERAKVAKESPRKKRKYVKSKKYSKKAE